MKSLLIVTKPLKTKGVYYPVGSIIEDPTRVKLLGIKTSEGKVITVTEDMSNLDIVLKTLEAKIHVPLYKQVKAIFTGEQEEQKEEKQVEDKKEETPKPAPKQTPVNKVTTVKTTSSVNATKGTAQK